MLIVLRRCTISIPPKGKHLPASRVCMCAYSFIAYFLTSVFLFFSIIRLSACLFLCLFASEFTVLLIYSLTDFIHLLLVDSNLSHLRHSHNSLICASLQVFWKKNQFVLSSMQNKSHRGSHSDVTDEQSDARVV